MRLVFVNHAHPDIPHVSGMRLSYFAREMAQRGHKVVLLTSTLPKQLVAKQRVEDLPGLLKSHKWEKPFHVEVQPKTLRALQLIRSSRMPGFLRRILTFWYMAYHGGVFEDWVLSCRKHARLLAKEFEPELVWGTFGNTSNLMLAQNIARQSNSPWMIDIKDNWSVFLRPGLREIFAWRFRDAEGYTYNSEYHKSIAEKWLRQKNSGVVYSGVASPFFCHSNGTTNSAKRDLILIGGTYDQDILILFLEGVNSWLETLSAENRASIRFVYVGADKQIVDDMLKRLNLSCETHLAGYLQINELAHLCKRALANCYLWSSSTFHHKLLELLSCGRSVIAFPGETSESRTLANQVDTVFSVCSDTPQLHRALRRAWNIYAVEENIENALRWQWSKMAVKLELDFNKVLRQHASK